MTTLFKHTVAYPDGDITLRLRAGAGGHRFVEERLNGGIYREIKTDDIVDAVLHYEHLPTLRQARQFQFQPDPRHSPKPDNVVRLYPQFPQNLWTTLGTNRVGPGAAAHDRRW